MTQPAITREAIGAARRRIAPFIRHTPVIDVKVAGVNRPVTLKLELFQHSGSFKARGAFNSLVDAKIGEGGVATASGGNHGAAVAYVCRELGHRAKVFVPVTSSPAKVARIASYGAEIVQQGANYNEALGLCNAYIAQSGAASVHAYDAVATLEGQGTLAAELEEQAPGLDTVLVAVGGGGLIGGIASWYGSKANVIGVEPITCNTLQATLAAGERVAIKPSGVAVDSLGATTVGELMFGIAREHIARVALVSDGEILEAQRRLWRDAQLVTEPGGATAYAALLGGAYKPQRDERVGVIVCGANTSMDVFGKMLGTE
jgi:threonine dehydratase